MELLAEKSPLTIAVDREHSALRLIVIAVFVGLWVVAFIIANTLIVSQGFNILAGLIAFGVAALGSRLLEPFLKQRWPSGRVVEVDENGVRLITRGKTEADVKSNDAVSVLLWRFKVPRRGRVPKGWYVVACAIEQDDNYLPVYTFVSPEQNNTLNSAGRFIDLMSEKAAKNVKQDSLRVAGEQRRVRVAESHRWHNGAEMTFEDFQQFIARLNGQFPQWLP